MDLWHACEKEMRKETFGRTRFRLKTGNRRHTSLSMVWGAASELELSKAMFPMLSMERRYVIARDITYDMFVSIYDINTAQSMVMRPSQHVPDLAFKHILKWATKARLKNLEVRIIGLQNTDQTLNGIVSKIHANMPNARLIELDLFGNETRHITLDLKTGSTYDLLLGNKIYGPAELINNVPAQDFAAKRSELAFI